MNLTEKTLISLLSASAMNKNIENANFKTVNWRDVYEEALAHNVHSLIYPVIKNLSKTYSIDKTLISEWRDASLIGSIIQINHIKQVKKILENFQKANIPVIALKGLALRGLYPRPELRSMSDADILVHKEDVERADKILINLGYYKLVSTEVHNNYAHEKHLHIEVHWTLIDELCIKTVSEFNNTLWQNTRTINIQDVSVLALSLEYELIHIILHMASHIKHSGFGIRQLLDVVVFVEAERNNINWNLFFEQARSYNIEKFVTTIFILCNELFEIELPHSKHITYYKNNSYLELFINEIFASGVYGKRNSVRITSTEMLDKTRSSSAHSKTKNKLLISLLLPTPTKLGDRYAYAKKFHCLIIFAWLHRILYVLFMRRFLVHSLHIAKERYELLQWLQL
jgi:hypothetical protein